MPCLGVPLRPRCSPRPCTALVRRQLQSTPPTRLGHLHVRILDVRSPGLGRWVCGTSDVWIVCSLLQLSSRLRPDETAYGTGVRYGSSCGNLLETWADPRGGLCARLRSQMAWAAARIPLQGTLVRVFLEEQSIPLATGVRGGSRSRILLIVTYEIGR